MSTYQLQDLHITDWLPAGVGPDDAIAMLAALATLATAVAMWQVLRPSTSFERRFEHIVQGKESLRASALAPRRGRQRQNAVGLMRETVTRLNLLRSKHAAEGRDMLAQAGIRSRDAMVGYLFARVSLPLLFSLALLADTNVFHLLPIPPSFGFVPPMIGLVLGFYAPTIYLRNAAAKRAKQIQLALPDGLDLMVI